MRHEGVGCAGLPVLQIEIEQQVGRETVQCRPDVEQKTNAKEVQRRIADRLADHFGEGSLKQHPHTIVVAGDKRQKGCVYISKTCEMRLQVGEEYGRAASEDDAVAWLIERMAVKRSRSITKTRLRLILEGQRYKCALTGQQLDPDQTSLDHTVPLSRGGAHDISNLQFITREVNRAKGAMLVSEFVEMCRQVVAVADGLHYPPHMNGSLD